VLVLVRGRNCCFRLQGGLRRTSLGSEFARHFGEFFTLEDVRKEIQILPRILP
jgi:hypothetical protein